VVLTLFYLVSGALAATFTLTNNCDYAVWPGVLSSAGTAALSTTGFQLQKGESRSLDAPAAWMECSGSGAAPPATLAEFTLDGSGGMDFYDVSLVDGYNLPMLVSVACKSACEAFGSPQYCCSGEFGNPNTCKPSSYSQFFKNACPRAYSYAYDDATSTFTCASANYRISFCPSTTSQKSSGSNPETAADISSSSNSTMVYIGGEQVSDATLTVPRLAALFLPVLLAPLALHRSF
ncbi:hypothetical protein B296_00009674, partial [Ensete ventricosum]